MKTKSFIVVTIMLFALVLSACAGAAPAAGSPSNLRTLSVSGSGEAFLAPDIAYIYVGVHTEAATAAEAVADNNTQTQELIQALIDFGIAAEDIRTTNFSIWPMDQFDPVTGRPTGEKTYAVDNTVYVTVRELDGLGDLLDAAVTAGANTVNSIQFDVADKDDALQQARAEAVEDAREQAQAIAQAAGLSLGEIQSISFIDPQPYPIFDGRGGGGGAAAEAAVPIQPGQLTFTVTVNVTYVLE
ncbi:MAG TPA: SIMPL domain-containing protein [Anaerolineales bacterium]|nr:SIMPL domain-containing protein [Anaerolineales bacterium]